MNRLNKIKQNKVDGVVSAGRWTTSFVYITTTTMPCVDNLHFRVKQHRVQSVAGGNKKTRSVSFKSVEAKQIKCVCHRHLTAFNPFYKTPKNQKNNTTREHFGSSLLAAHYHHRVGNRDTRGKELGN